MNLPFTDHIARYAVPSMLEMDWDSPVSRRELYKTLDLYRNNTIYESLGLAAFDPDLAANAATDLVRGVYNPVAAIVDAYRNYTLAGSLGPSDDAEADVHIVPGANAQGGLEQAILNIWRWSNLEIEKQMIPEFAANLGDALISVVGRPPGTDGSPGKVWLDVHHPSKLTEVKTDDRGNITFARIDETRFPEKSVDAVIRELEGRPTLTRDQSYTYTAIYTKTEFATFKDGKLYDYANDVAGEGGRWENPWGFVPLVLIPHKRTKDTWGLNAYADSISVINEVNLDASICGQLLGVWLAPQWVIFGIGAGQTLKRDGSAWKVEKDGKAQALVTNVDFAGAYVHIGNMLKWLADRQPELTLARVREKGLETGAAIRAMLFDLIRLMELAQDNYDDGLKRAIFMALTIGQNVDGNGTSLPGFTAAEIGVYSQDDNPFEFSFDRPDILPVSEIEKLQQEAEKQTLTRDVGLNKAINDGAAAGNEQTAAAALASRLLNGVANNG